MFSWGGFLDNFQERVLRHVRLFEKIYVRFLQARDS